MFGRFSQPKYSSAINTKIMISDSPYQVKGLALPLKAGAVAGILGAATMLGVLAIVQPLSGLSPAWLLRQIGGIILQASNPSGGDAPVRLAGLSLHVLLGSLLGILYAASQQRIPAHGMLVVGIFYGLMLWVVGGLLAGSLFAGPLRAALRSWSWLLSNLMYGLCLATVALGLGLDRRRSDESVMVKD
jgi:hypothetical protein